MIRNVIFDWSGTLVDDLPAVWATTNEVLLDSGLPELTLDQFRLHFRLPFEEFYRGFAAEIPLAKLEERFHARFPSRQHSVMALPHARAFLEFCRRQGLRTFVLSTVIGEYYHPQAKATGFGEYIDHCHLGVRDKRLEIGGLLNAHGLEPRETLFIGDMQHDIEAARHGGVQSCAVLTGYNGVAQLRDSGPDLIVEHLGELQAILERNVLNLRPPPGAAPGGDGGSPVVTVGALIRDDAGQVLMVRTRKWSNLWGIPGGKVKYGETLEAALRRETREETDLELDDIRLVLVQDCIRSTEFYREAHFVLVNYTARRRGTNEVRLNEEAQEYRWLPLADAIRLPLNRPTRALLESVSKSRENMDAIIIRDLEVSYRVGVPEAERNTPQRLSIRLELERDLTRAAATDALEHTIDYYAVTRRLLELGEGRSWRLIESLAAEIAELMLTEFQARAATVEVRKFIIPETRHVAVRVTRRRPPAWGDDHGP